MTEGNSSLLHICMKMVLAAQRGGNSAKDLRVIHTKDSSGGYGFLIYPERHLGKDYSHDAGDVRLNHEVAHFPFQVEVDRHYHIFT